MLEALGLDIRRIALVAPSCAQYTVYPYGQDHMILNSLYPTLSSQTEIALHLMAHSSPFFEWCFWG